jgi:hypothetical protein
MESTIENKYLETSSGGIDIFEQPSSLQKQSRKIGMESTTRSSTLGLNRPQLSVIDKRDETKLLSQKGFQCHLIESSRLWD